MIDGPRGNPAIAVHPVTNPAVRRPAPHRITLSRKPGWRKPIGAVVVSRPSMFGNPFTAAVAVETGYAKDLEQGRAVAVEAFRDWLDGRGNWWQGPESDRRREKILLWLVTLRGRNLCCWCKEGPCHADVLLELANRKGR